MMRFLPVFCAEDCRKTLSVPAWNAPEIIWVTPDCFMPAPCTFVNAKGDTSGRIGLYNFSCSLAEQIVNKLNQYNKIVPFSMRLLSEQAEYRKKPRALTSQHDYDKYSLKRPCYRSVWVTQSDQMKPAFRRRCLRQRLSPPPVYRLC